MAKTERRSMAKGLAVGVGILVGSLAGWGEGWAQMGASRGMPAPSGSVQSGGQVSVPSHQRHYDRDGDRHRDHDRDRHWHGGDRHRHYPPHVGYYSKHYPQLRVLLLSGPLRDVPGALGVGRPELAVRAALLDRSTRTRPPARMGLPWRSPRAGPSLAYSNREA